MTCRKPSYIKWAYHMTVYIELLTLKISIIIIPCHSSLSLPPSLPLSLSLSLSFSHTHLSLFLKGSTLDLCPWCSLKRSLGERTPCSLRRVTNRLREGAVVGGGGNGRGTSRLLGHRVEGKVMRITVHKTRPSLRERGRERGQRERGERLSECD